MQNGFLHFYMCLPKNESSGGLKINFSTPFSTLWKEFWSLILFTIMTIYKQRNLFMQRASFQFDGGGRKSKKVMMKRGKEEGLKGKIFWGQMQQEDTEEMTRHMTQSGVKKRRTRTKAEDVPHNGLKLPITLDFLTGVVSFRGKIAHCDVTICGVTFHLGWHPILNWMEHQKKRSVRTLK